MAAGRKTVPIGHRTEPKWQRQGKMEYLRQNVKTSQGWKIVTIATRRVEGEPKGRRPNKQTFLDYVLGEKKLTPKTHESIREFLGKRDSLVDKIVGLESDLSQAKINRERHLQSCIENANLIEKDDPRVRQATSRFLEACNQDIRCAEGKALNHIRATTWIRCQSEGLRDIVTLENRLEHARNELIYLDEDHLPTEFDFD